MIECRGRNGWFTLAEASVLVLHDGTATINISSKNPYRDMPPIYLSGSLGEMQDLLDDLQAQLTAEAVGYADGRREEKPYVQ